jgi:hypothetical protein
MLKKVKVCGCGQLWYWWSCRCGCRLGYIGLFGELEHLKIETRLIDEMFPSVMGEYGFLK